MLFTHVQGLQRRLAFLAIGLLLTPGLAAAQVTIVGHIVAEDTGEALPAATVQVKDRYVGTVSNNDGHFSIEVDGVPVTLVIRFIGYRTETITVETVPTAPLALVLEAAPFELPGVVVSSEDPAVGIMRRVIARKQLRRETLERFRADAYNRFTLENDTGIVSIVEGLSQFIWDHERGGREIVKASRQTENMEFDGFMPAALFVTNLYDDEIEVGGHTLYGVTHPDAIKHYEFRLEGTTRQDGREIYSISVKTHSRLTSGFEGTVVVADSVFAMLSVDLRPNDSFLFPPPIQFFEVAFQQQYLPYGEDQWLPADFRSQMDLKVGLRRILDFPVFRIRQFSRLSNYEINIPLADSLFESDDMVSVDSMAVAADSLLESSGMAVPLTAREEVAYNQIDSTKSVEEAFAPGGAMGRAARISMNEDEDGRSGRVGPLGFLDISPSLWYNRVEGWSPAAAFSVGEDIKVRARLGYSSGLKEWFQGYRAEYRNGRLRARAEWDRRVRPTYDSWTRGQLENSVSVLVGRPDYFDYYKSETARVVLRYRTPGRWPTTELTIQREDASAEATSVTFRLRGDAPIAPNPEVPDSRVGSVSLRTWVGSKPDPFGITSSNWAELVVEKATGGFLGGSEDFSRVQLRATWHANTFFRRRLLPQGLDIHLALGVSQGRLPAHRLLAVDGNNKSSRPGSLRTLEGRPYVGDRTFLVAWEHHFRTVPFERMGWRWAVERGLGIIAFGGHGRSWLRGENGPGPAGSPSAWAPNVAGDWHHEVGLSLNGVLGVLRLDVARRLDEPDWAVGFGVARLF